MSPEAELENKNMAIKKILISQRAPMNDAPYVALKEKFGVDITFKQFFLIEPLSSREFRAQRNKHSGLHRNHFLVPPYY